MREATREEVIKSIKLRTAYLAQLPPKRLKAIFLHLAKGEHLSFGWSKRWLINKIVQAEFSKTVHVMSEDDLETLSNWQKLEQEHQARLTLFPRHY